MENRISIEIPEADLAAAKAALEQVQSILAPYVIALTPDQRRTLPKMSDGTEPFVAKVVEYANDDPQFLPPFVDKGEFDKDWRAISGLLPLYRLCNQIADNLSDTTMLAGSEAYVSALSYYNSVKQAAKVNVPDAKAIYEDLRKRFNGQGRRSPNAPAE
ncbi:hypothetical protein Belba_2728 [Belliella baltica DSM 15883]|uniref:Uncharacterized protein n=1 Tax=Belliella baltica (strain DSM 15883 / CIP 108006 / LMG 21964 / BA134) TaxID=866536 RepID=I3Z7Q3_BELBD|nr:hypothetical protein [Belliella baltica]AFL85271.1 hypothetical protein Belba_2728 [Belliella baltica DSM 15883]